MNLTISIVTSTPKLGADILKDICCCALSLTRESLCPWLALLRIVLYPHSKKCSFPSQLWQWSLWVLGLLPSPQAKGYLVGLPFVVVWPLHPLVTPWETYLNLWLRRGLHSVLSGFSGPPCTMVDPATCRLGVTLWFGWCLGFGGKLLSGKIIVPWAPKWVGPWG